MKPPSFEAWLKARLSAPESEEARALEDLGEIPAPVRAEHLTRLFEDARETLSGLSDAETAGILENLLLNDLQCLVGDRLKPAVRSALVSAQTDLFRQVFAPRCDDAMWTTRDKDAPANPLNRVCFEWWEEVPARGRPANPAWAERDDEVLRVLAEILRLDSAACRESAVRGAGLWLRSYPDRVRGLIDAFLSRARDLPPALEDYARRMRDEGAD
jgi:hypothetical protein